MLILGPNLRASFSKGIFVIYITIKNIDKDIKTPRIPKSIFLKSKLRKKYIKDKNDIRIIKCPEGACFVRKAKPRIIGIKNQYFFESVFKAKTKQKSEDN